MEGMVVEDVEVEMIEAGVKEMDIWIDLMGWGEEVVGMKELLGCETKEWIWGELEVSSNGAERIGKVRKGVEIRMGYDDTKFVPIVAEIIWDKSIWENVCLEKSVWERPPVGWVLMEN